MIKAVFFDIGGVITHTDFDALYAAYARRVGLTPEFVADYHKKNLDELLLGHISLQRFWEDLRGGEMEDPETVWREEARKARMVDTAMLHLVDTLRVHVKTGTITNLTESRYLMDEEEGIYGHFDVLALSCRDHVKKPDPAFFRLALSRAGVAVEEAVFVDDKASLVEAAKFIGMQGIVFQNTEGLVGAEAILRSRLLLEEELKKLGLQI